jgi:hypothetical protein
LGLSGGDADQANSGEESEFVHILHIFLILSYIFTVVFGTVRMVFGVCTGPKLWVSGKTLAEAEKFYLMV